MSISNAKLHIFFLLLLIFISSCRSSKNTVTVEQSPTPTEPVREIVRSVYVAPPADQMWMAQVSDSSRISHQIDSILHFSSLSSTSLVGIEVYDLTADRIIYANNHQQRMRPASCMKLLTAITALNVLGPDYAYTPEIAQPGWGWCWDDRETRLTPYVSSQKTTIRQALQPMMKKSDNIVAESMFCQLAAYSKSPIEDRHASATAVNALIELFGMDINQFCIADGSGLSLYNYVSPHLITQFLRYAYSKKKIYNVLYPSLPVAGVDGTLKNRMKETPAYNNVHAKTGSVTGISSLSGYCTASNGHVLCFSIINQGVQKMQYGRDFQNDVCVIMCQ